MRIFTTYLLLVFSVFTINAQGNMQFNQVVRTKFTVTSPNPEVLYTAGTITVPQNKVWKIESGSIVLEGSIEQNYTEQLFVDGQLLYCWIGIRANNQNYPNNEPINAPYIFNSAPIWLPSGSYPITFRQKPYNNPSFTIAISALEFNIVP